MVDMPNVLFCRVSCCKQRGNNKINYDNVCNIFFIVIAIPFFADAMHYRVMYWVGE